MQVHLGSLKCTGKVGTYPSDIEQEQKRALEKRLNILNETLTTAISIPSLPSGYKKVKTDFGMVVYKLYTSPKHRPEALKTCTSDASFLHFPQPSNSEENLFYYDLVYQSATHNSYTLNTAAIWLDISKAGSWSNWAKTAPSVSENPYPTMMFKTGERERNWYRGKMIYNYYFVCTAVFN